MAIDKEQLIRLNSDYSALTGKVVQNFVCPITLLDDPVSELCDGHVLNKSIKKAAKVAVIQRKDVDNHFGRTIEPDLVRFLNIPMSRPQELIHLTRQALLITMPTGEKVEAFFANTEAREKFPQIKLFDSDGTLVASPFLRTDKLVAEKYKDLEVEWTMTTVNSAVIGSFIKSAYLALFRMLGYRWVLHPSGDKVRRSLATFYQDRAGKEQSGQYFAEFDGAVFVLRGENLFGTEDTLSGGLLLLHYAKGDMNTGLLFAQTCLFRINDQVLGVTLPCYQKTGYYFHAYEHYQSFLKSHSMCHSVYLGRFREECFEILPEPIQYVTETPPNE